jgi:carbon monoxide dehydrogenase subunit G
MRLENSFEVPAPIDEAWRLLTDVPRVVPCMPGAELVETLGDERWKAKVHVKLGPISLTFGADVTREILDAQAHRTVLSAKARELKGRGGAESTIESSLEPSGQGTKVTIVTDLSLKGAVAQYGRGIVADVSDQLVTQFAANLAEQLAAERPPQASAPDGPATAPAAAPREPSRTVKPVGGTGLFFRALVASIRRMFGRGDARRT